MEQPVLRLSIFDIRSFGTPMSSVICCRVPLHSISSITSTVISLPSSSNHPMVTMRSLFDFVAVVFVGARVGCNVGSAVGARDGTTVGTAVGLVVGAAVGAGKSSMVSVISSTFVPVTPSILFTLSDSAVSFTTMGVVSPEITSVTTSISVVVLPVVKLDVELAGRFSEIALELPIVPEIESALSASGALMMTVHVVPSRRVARSDARRIRRPAESWTQLIGMLLAFAMASLISSSVKAVPLSLSSPTVMVVTTV
mmetsp:Transcript_58169/g.162165  ORF Transcript_58169/g.162165 Transcript_58169/m.162165 type:complete len:255 (+) Transcript_58169:859-1623(+)